MAESPVATRGPVAARPSLTPAEAPPDPVVGVDAPILEIMRTTRALRRLAPDPVPRDVIRAVIEAATWAPSGGNWQPAVYLVVTDRAKIRRLAPLWGQVIDDFRLLAAAAGIEQAHDDTHRRMAASIEYQRTHFAEIPALIVICEDPRAAGESRGTVAVLRSMVRRGGLRRTLGIARARGRLLRSEGASFYPAAENLLLAARAHGLAACLTSWHLFDEPGFQRVLGVPADVRIWAVIPMGYPLQRFGPVRRRPVDDVIRWDTW